MYLYRHELKVVLRVCRYVLVWVHMCIHRVCRGQRASLGCCSSGTWFVCLLVCLNTGSLMGLALAKWSSLLMLDVTSSIEHIALRDLLATYQPDS